MKVRILEPAFFNNIYLNKGAIIDLNIDECPSWAEVIGEKPKAKEAEKEENKPDSLAEVENNNEDKKEEDKPIFDEVEKQKEYLEELLNKAFDKGILLEGTENKTVDEQIKELEELLKG